MVEIELDGKKVEVAPGSMVMHAAEKAGVYIPHFCYHKKLSIAANCRMCLVEVEKAPKALPACATPVTQGMVVRTKSKKALDAQQSVMEFLLVNHPLDCPICDQGGECQLQDLAVGYGAVASRFTEEKRVVAPKDIGPLVSTQEMTRCVHCTRCVRFGEEIAGVMELGMVNRGEYAEITTVHGGTLDSELSGNVIDLCPVGALTSKPFRYSARTWELSRRKSVSPHDSTGANLIVQVKNHRVMRVVPMENEAVNECWIADRDRFSYEALNGDERLHQPMVKQNGQWQVVDWHTALDFVVKGLTKVRDQHGASSVGALVSPHSTLEELYLTGQMLRSMGSDSIDYRLRHAQFNAAEGVRWLGMPIAALQELQSVLVVGSNLRKDHPLFAHRVRQAAKRGGQVFAINTRVYDWAMPVTASVVAAQDWAQALADVAVTVAHMKGVTAPVAGSINAEAQAIATALLKGERKAILLGNAAAHHVHAVQLLALAQWIAQNTGAVVGYLTEAANTVGAQWMKAQPQTSGLNAAQMLSGDAKALILLNTEPQFDSAAGTQGLQKTDFVVTLSPFKANMDCSDVLLPIAPFTETSGTFVNAEGRVQNFHAVVKPQGEARPGWKVLRVMANLLNLQGFDYESSQDVLNSAIGLDTVQVPAALLSNATQAAVQLPTVPGAEPVVASIYQLDGIVRRAPSLQATIDARSACEGGIAA